MRFDQVSISSVSHVDGADRVTSAELETKLAEPMRRLGLQPGFLEGVTGIRARRMWGVEFQPSQAATAAAELAIAQAGIDRSRLGIVKTSWRWGAGAQMVWAIVSAVSRVRF